MKYIDYLQGSPEWHAYRREHFNASDAPAMMGCSPYKTRSELLHEMATGLTPEVDAETQRRFDEGHRAEALARPLAELQIGEDLFPVVGELGRLSASFDGITMDESTLFEHKTANSELREAIAAGNLPMAYRVQMEQQLHVSGASRCLFMISRWTRDGDLVENAWCWYYPDAALRAQIIAGWEQFAADLAAYVAPAVAEPKPTGQAPQSLPALRIEVTGMVTASNLAEFKATALGAIRAVNRELSTDQQFADAEQAVKWCDEVETRLAAAKQHALSQTASIDELFKTIDDISAEARRVRLDLEKLVKARKEAIRAEIVAAGVADLREHLAGLNAAMPAPYMPTIPADFAAAVKGKRTVDSLRDAVATELARAKIAAGEAAMRIHGNLATIGAAGMPTLFPDMAMLVLKAADDLGAIISSRKAAHEAAEAKRLAALAAATTPEPAPVVAAPPAVVSIARAPLPMPAPTENEPATLRLGVICERLGFTVSAAFLADVLHIPARDTDKRAVLYRESDWPLICHQIASHVSAMSELYKRAA